MPPSPDRFSSREGHPIVIRHHRPDRPGELTETFENRDEAFRVQTAMQNRNRRPYFVVVALASQIVGRK